MQKSVLLRALQQEIHRHDFNYFVDQPPSVAQGGKVSYQVGVRGGCTGWYLLWARCLNHCRATLLGPLHEPPLKLFQIGRLR